MVIFPILMCSVLALSMASPAPQKSEQTETPHQADGKRDVTDPHEFTAAKRDEYNPERKSESEKQRSGSTPKAGEESGTKKTPNHKSEEKVTTEMKSKEEESGDHEESEEEKASNSEAGSSDSNTYSGQYVDLRTDNSDRTGTTNSGHGNIKDYSDSSTVKAIQTAPGGLFAGNKIQKCDCGQYVRFDGDEGWNGGFGQYENGRGPNILNHICMYLPCSVREGGYNGKQERNPSDH